MTLRPKASEVTDSYQKVTSPVERCGPVVPSSSRRRVNVCDCVWLCVHVCDCVCTCLRTCALHQADNRGFGQQKWNMKWLHNLFARQSQKNTRSLPVHTLFVCTNGSNETRPAKKGNLSCSHCTETTSGNKSWRVKICGYGVGLFIYCGTDKSHIVCQRVCSAHLWPYLQSEAEKRPNPRVTVVNPRQTSGYSYCFFTGWSTH